jgi:hypothetical protein
MILMYGGHIFHRKCDIRWHPCIEINMLSLEIDHTHQDGISPMDMKRHRQLDSPELAPFVVPTITSPWI